MLVNNSSHDSSSFSLNFYISLSHIILWLSSSHMVESLIFSFWTLALNFGWWHSFSDGFFHRTFLVSLAEFFFWWRHNNLHHQWAHRGENYAHEHIHHVVHYVQIDHHETWSGYVVVEPDHAPQEDVHRTSSPWPPRVSFVVGVTQSARLRVLFLRIDHHEHSN